VAKKKDLKDVLLDAVEKSDLSEKQKLFCVYFVSCHNATQAYLMAYKCKKTSAETQGWVTLQNPAIKKEIARLKKLMRQELDVTVNDYINYLLKVVGADIGNYVKFGQKKVTKKGVTFKVNKVDLIDSDKLDTSVITEVKEGRDGVSFKLEDKKWAWEQLAKYLGFDEEAAEGEATIIELPVKE
jgi:phage terminase small subunit